LRSEALVPSILLILAAFGAPLSAQGHAPGIVYGKVTDRKSGDPVVAADLWLEGTDIRRVSDPDGTFDFGEVPPGAYMLHIRHIGYQEIADTLNVRSGKFFDLDVQMAPRAIELAPIVVVAEYGGGSGMQGFYERKRMTMGSFITRSDIERQHATEMSDLFRSVRGMHVVPVPSPSGLNMGYHVLMRGNCRPTVFIDGTETMSLSMSLDHMVQPDEVQGIEVYRGPETPVQYQRNGCGAILVWTRPGGKHGGIALWKGVLIAGGAILAILLLGR
jgi:hypothetical protein